MISCLVLVARLQDLARGTQQVIKKGTSASAGGEGLVGVRVHHVRIVFFYCISYYKIRNRLES